MNLLSNMEEIADLIIRPSRYTYKPIDLGPKLIQHEAKSIYHHDFEVRNNRGLLLKASLYTPNENFKQIKQVIVYLHCNSGCRIEGLAYMKMAVSNDYTYVVFDFAGSGISEGKYVSLGFHEVDDIKSILKHLKKRIGDHIKFILWGRSMGAVSALRFLTIAGNQQMIQAAVFDSPFYSLKDLFVEIGKERTSLPKIVLEVALKYLKPVIQEKAHFDIDEVNLSDLAKIKGCPGVFIASKNDSLIPFGQMNKIFKEFNGQKEMLFVEQSHNESRNPVFIKEVFSTLKKYLANEESEFLYRSHLPEKNQSRKKLQLTIKSLSQKSLLWSQTPRKKGLQEMSFPHLEKRQISCLFENKKKSQNSLSQDQSGESQPNKNPSLKNKKSQIMVRKFFNDENTHKSSKLNLIKYRSQKVESNESMNGALLSRDKERKTMQHIASKKPPFIDNHAKFQFRNSCESKYRLEYRK